MRWDESFQAFYSKQMETRTKNSRKCEVCKTDVHRASYANHLKIEKHLESIQQEDMIIPDLLFQEPNESPSNMLRRINNPKPLKQIASEIIKIDDKQLRKELATKMINPSCFTDRILKAAFNITLDIHHINHINSNHHWTHYFEIEKFVLIR